MPRRSPLSILTADFPRFLFSVRVPAGLDEKGGNMATEAMHESEEQTIEKAVWHYVGVAVLWLSLLATGIAVERLGLTTRILSGIVPGEVGSLRNEVTECKRNLGTVDSQRD